RSVSAKYFHESLGCSLSGRLSESARHKSGEPGGKGCRRDGEFRHSVSVSFYGRAERSDCLFADGVPEPAPPALTAHLRGKLERKMAGPVTFHDTLKQPRIADFTSAYDVSRKCDEKTMKRLDGRTVGNAVDTLGPEMPLERFHDEFRRLVEQAFDFQAVPIDRQHRLQRLDRLATVAHRKEAAPL